jgi:hypothetical protein
MYRPALAIMLCVMLPLAASAKDRVYRWVDSRGVVHYAQTEPDKIRAQARDVRTSKPATPAAKRAVVSKGTDEVVCGKARANAALLDGKTPLQMDKNGDGKPETMSTDDRQAARELNDKLIRAYCKA